jgi:hypothetical protein
MTACFQSRRMSLVRYNLRCRIFLILIELSNGRVKLLGYRGDVRFHLGEDSSSTDMTKERLRFRV